MVSCRWKKRGLQSVTDSVMQDQLKRNISITAFACFVHSFCSSWRPESKALEIIIFQLLGSSWITGQSS
jgi:hypothetical protein